MKSAIISLVVIIGIAGAGFFAWKTFGPKPAPAVPVVAVDTRSTYATSTYSVRYPGNFVLNAQYAYDQFGPKKLINGVKFSIPATMAMASTSSPQAGTNLSADTGVSVEQLPRAKNCTGDIYLMASVTAHNVTDNGTEYSFASSTGAAAGNRYEEHVYALATSSPCTAVRYFIHSSNIGNYPAGMVREFDSSALISAFDNIRQSVLMGL